MKRALEEKKLAREEARNAERLAMHNFHEKTSHVEVISKVCCNWTVFPPYKTMAFLESLFCLKIMGVLNIHEV